MYSLCINLCCIAIVVMIFFVTCNSFQRDEDFTKVFSSYDIIDPVISISSPSRQHHIKLNGLQNVPNFLQFKVAYNTSRQEFILDLRLNRHLFTSSYFESYQHHGKKVTKHPRHQEIRGCYYKGKIVGNPHSWAAVSLCNSRISGVIFDGNETYVIEPSKENNTFHYYGKLSSIKDKSWKCGVSDEELSMLSLNNEVKMTRAKRRIRGPSLAHEDSLYVEILLIIDKFQFNKMKRNRDATFHRYTQVANILNAIYEPLDIYIALVGIIIWSDSNKIAVSSNGQETLNNFLKYRKDHLLKEHHNDNAQLITGVTLSGGAVGKAVKGSMCTSRYSGGVNMDHGSIAVVASTVAHEVGHNFGLEHDGPECYCARGKCIMAPVTSYTVLLKTWSTCSTEMLLRSRGRLEYCLKNKPKTLVGPVCGNGFVEEGEECDCGQVNNLCSENCCDIVNCKLHRNATCATGSCCDLNRCQAIPAGHVCRSVKSECDLAEYCNGKSEYCPDDLYKQDGTRCRNAFCAYGRCRASKDQCHLLWGPDATVSIKRCFERNYKGDTYGHCGHNSTTDSYKMCDRMDVDCGLLHCTSDSGKLKFGKKISKHVASITMQRNSKKFVCRSVTMDYESRIMDPGLVPNGARCGQSSNMMCLNQKCIDRLSVWRKCPRNCNGAGVCNNLRQCHCNVGYSAPYCDVHGPGGSVGSGPASSPSKYERVNITYALCFGLLLPVIFIVIALVVFRNRIKIIKDKYVQRRRRNISKISGVQIGNVDRQLRPDIIPSNSVRDPWTHISQVKLVNVSAAGSTRQPSHGVHKRRAPPPPPPKYQPTVLNEKKSQSTGFPQQVSVTETKIVGSHSKTVLLPPVGVTSKPVTVGPNKSINVQPVSNRNLVQELSRKFDPNRDWTRLDVST